MGRGDVRRRDGAGNTATQRCTVPECYRVARNRGLCDMHYTRLRRYGDVGPAMSLLTPRSGTCQVLGCGRSVKARGLCPQHYELARTEGQVCSVEGCERRVMSTKQMLCCLHYERIRRTGNVGPAGPLIAGKGEGNWYRRVYLEQGSMLEHRFVMESILGRALYPEEEVHHKNGRRWDNRPENLELWTRSHPIGVRVSDLLDYVVWHYREELDERLQTWVPAR